MELPDTFAREGRLVYSGAHIILVHLLRNPAKILLVVKYFPPSLSFTILLSCFPTFNMVFFSYIYVSLSLPSVIFIR